MTQLRTRSIVRRKVEMESDTYTIYGIILIIACVGLIFLGNFSVGKIEAYQSKLQEIKNRYEMAVKRREAVALRLKRAAPEMEEAKKRAEEWQKSDAKLPKPWATSVPGWLALSMRAQSLPLMDEGTTSQAASPDKLDTIEMQTSGDFASLLTWLMQAEHELDMIRVIKTTWQTRPSSTLGLTVTMEVSP